MNLLQTLEEEFHGHKKAIEDTPETEHTRILFLRRLESLVGFIEERFPDDDHRKKALATIHDLRRHGENSLDDE